MPTRRRYRCKSCQAELPAWIEVPGEVDGPMLLSHLGRYHPDQVGAYLDQMRGAENIAQVVIPAYEVVEDRRVSAFLRRHLPTMLGVLGLLTVVVAVWSLSLPIAQWVRSALSFDAVAFLREHLLAVGMFFGGCLMVLALIWLPKRQAARPELTPQAQVEVENDARKTLAEIIGGAAVLAGLFFTGENLGATQENLRITQETATKSQELTREGQITERFTTAIDQLGAVNDKGEKQLEIRLGGIYALERIARDSKRDHWPIMEILTAYVRAHAPWPPKDVPPLVTYNAPIWPTSPPPADIQAILRVLRWRTQTFGKGEDQRLELNRTDLRVANLQETHLEGADLRGARLEGAYLVGAHLEEAVLREAQLEGAWLKGAHLEGAWLVNTYLWGANGLTVEQLCTAHTLYEVKVDPPLMEQIRQQCPKSLDEF
jgi:Pentapeptide repeats (8 copies)